MTTTGTAAPALASGDVPTKLKFFLPDPSGEPAYIYLKIDVPPGKPRRNSVDDIHDVVVHNARGLEGTFTLEANGFEFAKHTSAETEFADEEAITTRYYAEMEELVRKRTGAKRVLIWDHVIRGNWEGMGPDVQRPLDRIHVDQTYAAGPFIARRFLGEEAEDLLKGRFRIMNVWRPIGAPVYHTPLALADWRTFSLDDLVPVRLIFQGSESDVFNVRYNENVKWYYLKEHAPSEVTLFKCFDSSTDHGDARLCPHGSFHDAGSPPDAPQRRSIEVRALVFD
ncbi:hypothetical protein BOTBODRAFT_47050 [Botryobasidium botryosum FD-172 SS1]|uniref:Methyltransferase n=1 Tax=Botryobasidium botryosum (strain FD-172 SS1) TaxID=930990 RepID=A0A067MFM7_BOTB1|nr:hypothetical protein BOTBODRAFT_47050 [Botryobasidium botryosum FD-172 SS1]